MPEVAEAANDTLRQLGTGEMTLLEELAVRQEINFLRSGLDPRSYSLVKIAALVVLDAPPASYLAQIAYALENGVSAEDLVGVLVAVAPQVGLPRVIAAAPEIAVALGLSIEAWGVD